MKLQDIAAGQSLAGIEASQVVSVMATVPHGEGALQLIYRTPDGAIKERLLSRDDEASVEIATAEVPTATAKMRLVQIADEIVSVLCSDPNATVRLVVEIAADFPEGASDTVKRAVSENARSLAFKSADWE
jgi:hypothetical protein